MDAARRTPDVPLLFVDGTRVRKSPYWEATERSGCLSYDIYNHMYIRAGTPIPSRSTGTWSTT